ncbi:MAG: DUF502 domain-containing protein [Firmicutes bacterium]|nr:DUF502 domain-containing protein [Bacillota bacterium]
MWKKFRNYVGTGIFVVMPAVITGYVLWFILRFADGVLGDFLEGIIGRRLPGMGLLALLVILFGAGLFTTNYVGKRALGWLESLLMRLPFVGSIYGTTRQFAEALSTPEHGGFRKVVMLEYPRPGLYTLGFLTGRAPVACIQAAGREMVNVFVPTVPNPTTGFLLQVPEEELLYPMMSVDQGLKLLLSAGVVKPENGREEREGEG